MIWMAVELNYTTREGDRVDYLRTVSERGGPRDGEHALPNVLKCTHLRNSMMNLASPHPSTHYCAAQLQLHTTWVQTGGAHVPGRTLGDGDFSWSLSEVTDPNLLPHEKADPEGEGHSGHVRAPRRSRTGQRGVHSRRRYLGWITNHNYSALCPRPPDPAAAQPPPISA